MTRSVIKINFLLTEVQTTFVEYTIHLMCLLPHLNQLNTRVGYQIVLNFKHDIDDNFFAWIIYKTVNIYINFLWDEKIFNNKNIFIACNYSLQTLILKFFVQNHIISFKTKTFINFFRKTYLQVITETVFKGKHTKSTINNSQ